MNSPSAARIGRQQPRVSCAPAAAWSHAEDAAFLAKSYGLDPDEWQMSVLTAWFGERDDGKWAASRCGLAVPRQNGKNAVLEVAELYKMVALGRKILHTAHEVKTARKAFIRLSSFFENPREFPELAELVISIRKTNGQEAILLKNGGSVEFIARSKGSGRGFTVDDLVCDEAQDLNDDALAALLPTISAAPSGNPQVMMTGTPPSYSVDGEVWARTRQGAIAGTDDRIAWSEWSVPEEFEFKGREDALEAAWDTNPALGIRLGETVVADEFAAMDADTFARERLGRWNREGSALASIRSGEWACLEDSYLPPGRAVFGVKFSIDGATVGLAGAIRPDEGPVVVSGIRLASTAEGLSWLADWLAERSPSTAQIVVDGRSGVSALVEALAALGVKAKAKARPAGRFIRVPTLGEYVEAHVLFRAAVREGELAQTGSATLAQQVSRATTRKIGTAGGWAWQGIGEADDVTLLDAATLAFWGAKTTIRKTRREAA